MPASLPRIDAVNVEQRSASTAPSPESVRGLRGNRSTVIGGIVSVVALAAVVIWAVGQPTPQVPDSPGHWALAVAAVGIYWCAMLIRGWRWHVILRHADIPHATADALTLVPIGYMGNTVLPARGGEFLRIFLLGQRTTSRRRAILGTILSERVLDASTLVIVFAVVTFAGVAGSPLGTAPALGALAVLALAAVGLWVYLRLRTAGRFERVAAVVRPVLGTARPLLGSWGAALFAVSLGLWGLESAIFWLVGASLSIDISVPEALFLVVLTSVTSLIPAAPGYIGTFEASAAFGLHAMDVTGSAAVSYVVLIRLVLFAPVTLVGLALLAYRFGGLGALHQSLRAQIAD